MRGVPLAFYTLGVILGYCFLHDGNSFFVVAVNTDSDPLKQLFQSQDKLKVGFIERKEDFAGDVVPQIAVVQDDCKYSAGASIDVVIDLDITSPYCRICDIENIMSEYSFGKYEFGFQCCES